MLDAKTVQLQLDRPRNWRFTTGARIRLCDCLHSEDGFKVILELLGEPDKPDDPKEVKADREAARQIRINSKDGHIKMAALIWCGQIPTDNPLSETEILEVIDDELISECLPLILRAMAARRENPTEASAEQKPTLEEMSV